MLNIELLLAVQVEDLGQVAVVEQVVIEQISVVQK